MSSSLQGAIILVIVVTGMAWLLRVMSSGKPASSDSLPSRGDVDRLLAEVSGGARAGREDGADDEDEGPEVVALTSDGWAFVPDGDEVELIPPGDPEDVLPAGSSRAFGDGPSEDPSMQPGIPGAPVNPKTGRRMLGWKPGEHLDVGDLIAARIKRGAPDHDPWRLEALGRDREFRAWRFETEEAARAALDLVQTRIVRPARDQDGEPVVIGDEDFAVARRIEEETEAELANDINLDDDEER
jgi:hypothetical protein